MIGNRLQGIDQKVDESFRQDFSVAVDGRKVFIGTDIQAAFLAIDQGPEDKQNIFYTSISKYYSNIFPYKPMQLQFVKNELGKLEKANILDVGCATGELASKMAINGAMVTGIDLNVDLLKQAQKAQEHPNLTFQPGNMLDLKEDFESGSFDAVLCFGNTLAHLQNEKLVQQFLEGAYSIIKSGGKLMIQILNYDYITESRVSELPLIETEDIAFIRKYKFTKQGPVIQFHTELVLKKEERMVSNETPLLALGSKQLLKLLKVSGFTAIQMYSNFKGDKFGGPHLPLVLSAVK